MVRSKTPWENMKGDNSLFLERLTKSERRRERERRIDETSDCCLCDVERNILWWTWRICLGIIIGLTLMVGWSAASGLLG